MLGIPFVGDDALRANIDGWLAVHHRSLLDAFRAELFREDFSNGRFHPLFIALTLLETRQMETRSSCSLPLNAAYWPLGC